MVNDLLSAATRREQVASGPNGQSFTVRQVESLYFVKVAAMSQPLSLLARHGEVSHGGTDEQGMRARRR